MTALAPLRAAQALSAYQAVDSGAIASPASSGDFASLLQQSLGGAISRSYDGLNRLLSGQQAETQAASAINGGGDLTSVVTAVSRAELALQTTVAVRDRVLQAYQDIIKMPI